MAQRPKGATALGSHFYLFKSETNKTDCLISAHGGYKKTTSDFTVKGCTLYFYVDHDFALADPGMALMYKKGKPVETISDNQKCRNYILSKYQGRHSKSGETYETIHDAIQRDDAYTSQILSLKGIMDEKSWKLSMQQTNSMNILTIRNRWFNTNQNLSDAIAAARREMSTLVNFHCSFCRCLVGGTSIKTGSVEYQPLLSDF
ncbi:hypothetical protein HL658_06770 [Azospirillum sp. RWY-5-1]|uniref:Putative adhesin Stv domain-containing protein n=1 Tax=Azospirillum oleiclasticum TaxID=2735135 RepID=A0ABX2T6H0_9PROT|nr:hypothetical protein [Azospirillum oleiclasticum]NYZ12245.1 hypothetical protein [Azospirillum oleiclasticum]NYZ19405.1 hypothetical protein [Azospirillum oleiclasticum]